MNRNRDLAISNQKGMTLLEIMIVLVILGSLAGVLAVNVNSQLKKSRINQTKIKIGELGKALDMYYTDCNGYPSSDSGLTSLIEAPSDCANWGPDPYLTKKAMLKDSWDKPFIYENNGNSFTLMSYGADGREGGDKEGRDISSDDDA